MYYWNLCILVCTTLPSSRYIILCSSNGIYNNTLFLLVYTNSLRFWRDKNLVTECFMTGNLFLLLLVLFSFRM
jgi:hypothetical protein